MVRTKEFGFEIKASKGEISEYYAGFEKNDLTLKHDGSYTILNLPTDAVLSIKENNDEYEVSVEVIQSGTTTVISNSPEFIYTLQGHDATIVVNNTLEMPIDTGINLDSLPYILLLLTATAGIGFMVVRRRRQMKD